MFSGHLRKKEVNMNKSSLNSTEFDTRTSDIRNAASRLEAIERQLVHYRDLSYHEGLCHMNSVPHPCSGLSEEDFQKFRSEILVILKLFYNKELENLQSLGEELMFK